MQDVAVKTQVRANELVVEDWFKLAGLLYRVHALEITSKYTTIHFHNGSGQATAKNSAHMTVPNKTYFKVWTQV